MTQIKKTSLQKGLAGIAFFFGAILMLAGIINGNAPLKSIHIDNQDIQTISLSEVEYLKQIYHNRNKVVEIKSDDKCVKHIVNLKFQNCYSVAQLKNSKWMRQEFSSMRRPVVIYSENTENRNQAASLLKHYGYDVRILTDHKIATKNLSAEISQVKYLIAQADQQDQSEVNLDEMITPVQKSATEGESEQDVLITEEASKELEPEAEEGC